MGGRGVEGGQVRRSGQNDGLGAGADHAHAGDRHEHLLAQPQPRGEECGPRPRLAPGEHRRAGRLLRALPARRRAEGQVEAQARVHIHQLVREAA